MSHIKRIRRGMAYERVQTNLRTAETFCIHALNGLPESAPAYVVNAIKDARDELRTALEMAEEAQVDVDGLRAHLELLADALAMPGRGRK